MYDFKLMNAAFIKDHKADVSRLFLSSVNAKRGSKTTYSRMCWLIGHPDDRKFMILG